MTAISKRRSIEIWPGFVDATASLLMVVVFVLMLASIGQLFLTTEISGRDAALGQLNARVAELADQLSMQTVEANRLNELLTVRSASLDSATAMLRSVETKSAAQAIELAERDQLVAEQSASIAKNQAALVALKMEIEAFTTLRDSLRAELESTIGERDDVRERLARTEEINLAAQAQMEHLNRQLSELGKQLAVLNDALASAEADNEVKQTAIDSLGERLNLALASEAQVLRRYRSEFFGRLRESLANYPGIQVVGDRFVLPSGLLFQSGSDELDKSGRQQVAQLAATLQALAERIPDDIDWVLRVDGHTDVRAINSERFSSNWELSAARAIRIVRELATQGIDPHRLAATGFAEYHPLDPMDTEAAYARNRRIEIKLTSR